MIEGALLGILIVLIVMVIIIINLRTSIENAISEIEYIQTKLMQIEYSTWLLTKHITGEDKSQDE